MDRPSDLRIEIIIGGLLRAGVILSCALVAGGGIGYLLQYGERQPAFRNFHGVPEDMRTVTGILRAAAAFDARAWIQLGLLVLIATPVARVLFSAIAFGAQRDRTYVIITLIVAAVLAFSLFGGH